MPRMRFYLREPKIRITRIHASNFFSSWSTQDLKEGIYISTQQCANANSSNLKIMRKLTLIISTSWSTAFSPGNNGCKGVQTRGFRENLRLQPTISKVGFQIKIRISN